VPKDLSTQLGLIEIIPDSKKGDLFRKFLIQNEDSLRRNFLFPELLELLRVIPMTQQGLPDSVIKKLWDLIAHGFYEAKSKVPERTWVDYANHLLTYHLPFDFRVELSLLLYHFKNRIGLFVSFPPFFSHFIDSITNVYLSLE